MPAPCLRVRLPAGAQSRGLGMSGRRPDAYVPLDASSKSVMRRFGARTALIAGLAILTCVVSGRSLHEAIGFAALAFSLCGTVSTAFAAMSWERIGCGSLNGWDEALAFVAASRLAHAALVLQG